MKYFLLFTVFFHSLLYSQIENKVDSVTYYSKLATENIKNNNYNFFDISSRKNRYKNNKENKR